MSVLIKGLEMPKTCYECPFAMEYYSTLYMRQSRKFRKDFSCVITHKALTGTKRNRACPLIEIPPHGRLIDADALKKDGWKLFKQVGSSIHEMPLNNPSIPTIIEAEVDE